MTKLYMTAAILLALGAAPALAQTNPGGRSMASDNTTTTHSTKSGAMKSHHSSRMKSSKMRSGAMSSSMGADSTGAAGGAAAQANVTSNSH